MISGVAAAGIAHTQEPAGSLEIRVLGAFTVWRDGVAEPPTTWKRARASWLIKLLAISSGHSLPSSEAGGLLWPQRETEEQCGNLRLAAEEANAALGDSRAILIDDNRVAMAATSLLAVDDVEFAAAALAALRCHDIGCVANAAGLYRGELLSHDRYLPWTEAPRQRLRNLYVELLNHALCVAGPSFIDDRQGRPPDHGLA